MPGMISRMFEWGDLFTVGVLIVLEGLLSADNAMVMAVMVLGLPAKQHQKALQYGLIGAFVFRFLTTLVAFWLIRLAFAKVIGGVYLLYLPYQHFWGSGESTEKRRDAAEGEALARPLCVLGDGGESRADEPRFFDRFDPGGCRDVSQDVGSFDRGNPGDCRDANRGGAVARVNPDISCNCGWGVHHYRVGWD